MEQGTARITVCFEDPFWVCLFEREQGGRLEVSRTVFGAEPRDQEVYLWLLEHWRGLRFSPPVAVPERDRRPNARRRRREAGEALRARGTGTKAQQALQLQREQEKTQRREDRCRRDQAEEARRFQLRQEKKKARHRGR